MHEKLKPGARYDSRTQQYLESLKTEKALAKIRYQDVVKPQHVTGIQVRLQDAHQKTDGESRSATPVSAKTKVSKEIHTKFFSCGLIKHVMNLENIFLYTSMELFATVSSRFLASVVTWKIRKGLQAY